MHTLTIAYNERLRRRARPLCLKDPLPLDALATDTNSKLRKEQLANGIQPSSWNWGVSGFGV